MLSKGIPNRSQSCYNIFLSLYDLDHTVKYFFIMEIKQLLKFFDVSLHFNNYKYSIMCNVISLSNGLFLGIDCYNYYY